MNILIDINHPAQVHYFRNLYSAMKGKHNLIYTCKKVPFVEKLLNSYQIPFLSYGQKKEGIFHKAIQQITYDIACMKILKDNKIDIAFGSSVSNVHASLFTKAISIVTTDSDLAVLPLTTKYVYPYANYLLTPDSLAFQKHKKQICYPGFQELAYLHPKRFTPDSSVLEDCNLKPGERFFILRFTAFKAHHDIGMYGLSDTQKWELIKLLEPIGKVMITSEVNDLQFKQFAVPIAPEKIHSLLYYADMLICDSQTMTTESAILGTPAFRCNTFAGKLTVIEEIEKLYDLGYSYLPHHFNWMIKKIKYILTNGNYKAEWAEKRQRLIKDKIDVTAYWVWMLENAPRSLEETRRGEVNFDQFR